MTDRLEEVLGESRDLGFLGPGPIAPHIVHAGAFASVIDSEPARALDLGAGGGLPGLVLAARFWPGTRWTFLDAQQKRTAFLDRAIEALGLDDRVTVVTGRAEEIARDEAHRAGYDLVTSRSFGSPAATIECAAGFLADGGTLMVSEPPDPAAPRWPDGGLASLGFEPAVPHRVDGENPVHLVTMRRSGPLSERIPRRVGMPTKRPLF